MKVGSVHPVAKFVVEADVDGFDIGHQIEQSGGSAAGAKITAEVESTELVHGPDFCVDWQIGVWIWSREQLSQHCNIVVKVKTIPNQQP